MTSEVLLVAAGVVTSTIAVVLARWSFLAYLDFKESQEKAKLTRKRFAEIRAGALEESGSSLPSEKLTEEDLVKLLFEIQFANLADVPKEWIERSGQLGKRNWRKS